MLFYFDAMNMYSHVHA